MLLSAGGSNKMDRQVASSLFTSDVEVIFNVALQKGIFFCLTEQGLLGTLNHVPKSLQQFQCGSDVT